MANATAAPNFQLQMTRTGFPLVDPEVFVDFVIVSPNNITGLLSNGIFTQYLGNFTFQDGDVTGGQVSAINLFQSLNAPPIVQVTGVNQPILVLVPSADATEIVLSGDDVVTAGNLNDSVFAYFGNDVIFGMGGDDVLGGGPGNDTLNGGPGTDTADFVGSSSQYVVQQQGAQIQVSDTVGGRDGVDLLSDTELLQFADGAFTLSSLLDVPDIENAVYRFFSTATNTHFYTASTAERDAVIDAAEGFVFEGAVFKAVEPTDPGADPVFRFFNTQTGVHFYTISTDERDAILASAPQFVLEGEAYFAHDTAEAGTIPLFRFFNTATGTHFYTASADERDVILNSLPEFIDEGTAYFVEGIA